VSGFFLFALGGLPKSISVAQSIFSRPSSTKQVLQLALKTHKKAHQIRTGTKPEVTNLVQKFPAALVQCNNNLQLFYI
jgi:hypothetical protein